MSVENAELPELEESSSDMLVGNNVVAKNQLDLVKGVKVSLQAFLGNAEMTVEELFELKENSVVTLDQLKNSPIDLLLDGNVVARGSLVIADENLGVQITDVLEP